MMLHGDGGPRYSEWNVGANHVRISSSRCSAPPILTSDVSISGVPGIPRGLKQYKVSIKPLVGHGKGTERQTQSLHRRKSMKHEDAELLGITSSPLSPRRVSEIRFDEQMIGGAGPVPPERMTPIRCYPRQDSNVFRMEKTNRSRSSRSSSSSSSVFMDGPSVQPETQVLTQMTGSIIQSERMNAMEEQIASLAGLVHHALSEKSHVLQDKLRRPSENNQLEAETQKPTALVGSSSPTPPAPPSDRVKMFSYCTSGASLLIMPQLLLKTGLGVESLALQVAFCGIIGFFTFLTPVLLHVVTKGYVLRLYHNANTDTYTAITNSFFLTERRFVFTRDQVRVPSISKMFSTFYAGQRGLLVNPDLFPVPQDYNHLMGYDKPFSFSADDFE